MELSPQTSDVSIEGLQDIIEISGGGLKATYIRRNGAPNGVDGYNITVENIQYPNIPVITEQFIFSDWWNAEAKGIVNNVTEGRNRFVAESYGGTKWKGWKNVSRITSGGVNERANAYSANLKSQYPVYTKYKGVAEVNIIPRQKNNVHLNMQPLNGRLAVVLENKKRNYAFGVSINGEWRALYYGNVICYLLNDDSPVGTSLNISIDFFKWNRKSGSWEYKKKERRTHRIEVGRNNTRLIELK